MIGNADSAGVVTYSLTVLNGALIELITGDARIWRRLRGAEWDVDRTNEQTGAKVDGAASMLEGALYEYSATTAHWAAGLPSDVESTALKWGVAVVTDAAGWGHLCEWNQQPGELSTAAATACSAVEQGRAQRRQSAVQLHAACTQAQQRVNALKEVLLLSAASSKSSAQMNLRSASGAAKSAAYLEGVADDAVRARGRRSQQQLVVAECQDALKHCECALEELLQQCATELGLVCPPPSDPLPLLVEAVLQSSVTLYMMEIDGQTPLWEKDGLDAYEWSAHIGGLEQHALFDRT
jgi:hypothetical protein